MLFHDTGGFCPKAGMQDVNYPVSRKYKTPCISEKPPPPPDQHPDKNSTPKSGLEKVGLVKSLVGWKCNPLSLWTSSFIYISGRR